MSWIRCDVCGRFLSYTEEFAYAEEYRWNSYDPQGGDPPEMVPVHKECAAIELGAPAVTTPEETDDA